MILADKIINERKKNGWSQEELAEQLSVSRQSISKWEGAQAIPDIQKILKMAELFGVSTDYLLKDEMEPEDARAELMSAEDTGAASNRRKVSMEEANAYLKTEAKVGPQIANAVSACIMSSAPLILLAGLSEADIGLTENAATGIGVLVLMFMIAAAVFFFIIGGARLKPYEYLEKEEIETEYGVIGMVTEKKKEFAAVHMIYTAVGVILCILSVVPLLVVSFLELPGYVVTAMVSVLLIIVAVGVNLLVRAGRVQESYEKLLQENEYSARGKRVEKITEMIGYIYWSIVTAIYLGWSFWTMNWGFTWLVWPVAGVLFGAVMAITKMVIRAED